MRQAILIVFNTLVPIAVIVAAALGARALVASRERPPQAPTERAATLVDVVEAVAEERLVGLSGQGTVVAAREVSLAPQVSGRVDRIHEQLFVGGHVGEGETILQVERSDFSLSIAELQTALDQAEANLVLEQGRQAVAVREWELYRELLSADAQDDALATREPQVESAEVAIDAAEARLRRARLDYNRTALAAPFDGVVRMESLEPGMIVGPNAPVVTLVDTDAFWIEVAVPYAQLDSIAIPGVNAERGSAATVRFEAFGGLIERQGNVVRMRSELDGNGRMAIIIVEVRDPLELERPVGERRPLLLGAFVDVAFEGARRVRAVRVPRVAIREGNKVWVASDEGTLQIRDVDIAYRDVDYVLVNRGVTVGESLITSRLGGVTEGMGVRLASDEAHEDVPPDDPTTEEGPLDDVGEDQ